MASLGENERALFFSIFNDSFPLLFEQGALNFHCALGPKNDRIGSALP